MRALAGWAALGMLTMTGCAGAHSEWIRWSVDAPDPRCPEIESIVLSTSPWRDPDGSRLRWIRFDVHATGKVLFALAVLVPDGAADPFARGDIRRYVLYPGGSGGIEYIDARTGVPVLPGFEPWDELFPRGEDSSDLRAPAVRFAGRRLHEVARGLGDPILPEGIETRLLDRDVIVATGRAFRDDGTGRPPGGDWTWVPLEADDYRRMIETGFNLFDVTPHNLPFVLDEPVFFTMAGGYRDHPELPWRPNFLGAFFYADEPAIRAMRDGSLRSADTLPEAARALTEAMRSTLDAKGPYGRGFLQESAAKQGCFFGSIRPTWAVSWEAVASAAAYQLEAGASGICWESRLRPARFASLVREVLGVDFPADARSCIDYHLALLRGPARALDARWGVSIYGQMDSTAADLLFPRAYDAGASLFWLWTSDRDHHVPFDRQLRLVAALRARQREHPRDGGAAAATRSAETVLLVPRGCPLDELALADSPGVPWGRSALRLSTRSGTGSVRAVAADALRAAADLLRRGEDFDILPTDGTHVDGYARRLHVTDPSAGH